MAGRLPDFLIVGTPRSGTTLVQRLATELPGVAVPPETHLFTEFVPELLQHHRVPLAGDELRSALEVYRAKPYLEGVDLDVDGVYADLGGDCGSLLDLYGAVVGRLVGADPTLVGEKTPGHLLWWEPLLRAMPDAVLVAVVRDPRATASSYAEVGWGGHPVLTARRWLDDVRRIRAAQAALGDRCLVVRYEDVVMDPDASRGRLGIALGSAAGATADAAASSPALFPSWETWKAPATGAVDSSRADAWRGRLPEKQAIQIAAVCHRAMGELGYQPEQSAVAALFRRVCLPPALRLRLVKARVARRRRDAGIRRMAASLR